MIPPRKVTAVPAIIATCALVFLHQTSLSRRAADRFIDEFALSAEGLHEGRWWQLGTHAFLHGNLWHLFFNMAALWFAGRLVERAIGTGRFLLLYALSALAGGIAQLVLVGGPSQLLGASGAVFGVVIALCTLFPEAQIFALLFFVVPIRLRAKYLAWGMVASTMLFLVTGFEPWIGHAAHLGGCIAGFLFARGLRFTRPDGEWSDR